VASKIPWFSFYVGDWQKDPNLRRCSHAAKGVLIDMLCLAFECEERGVLATNGEGWTREEIAQAVGGDPAQTVACIDELTLKGVIKRDDKGRFYSSRMVRDEHKRQLCSEAGKRGGNPNLKLTLKGGSKGDPKGMSKPNPTPSESLSESESEVINTPPTPKGAKPRRVRESFDAKSIEIPEALNTPAFVASWGEWVDYLTTKRKRPTEPTTRKQLTAMEAVGATAAIAAIDKSISAGWTGVFPESQGASANGSHRGRSSIHAGPGQTYQPGQGTPAGRVINFGD